MNTERKQSKVAFLFLKKPTESAWVSTFENISI